MSLFDYWTEDDQRREDQALNPPAQPLPQYQPSETATPEEMGFGAAPPPVDYSDFLSQGGIGGTSDFNYSPPGTIQPQRFRGILPSMGISEQQGSPMMGESFTDFQQRMGGMGLNIPSGPDPNGASFGDIVNANPTRIPAVENAIWSLPEPIALPLDIAAKSINPITVASLPFFGPEMVGKSILGTAIGSELGYGAEKAGVPSLPTPIGDISPVTAGGILGGFYGAGAGHEDYAAGLDTLGNPLPPRPSMMERAAQTVEESGGVSGLGRRVLSEETGGTRFGPRGGFGEEPLPETEEQTMAWRDAAQEHVNRMRGLARRSIVTDEAVASAQKTVDEANAHLAELRKPFIPQEPQGIPGVPTGLAKPAGPFESDIAASRARGLVDEFGKEPAPWQTPGWKALEDVPERAEPIAPKDDLPGLKDFSDQENSYKDAVTQARDRLQKARNALGQNVMSEGEVQQARDDLKSAWGNYREAQTARREAEIKAGADYVMDQVKELGGDPKTAAILAQAFKDSGQLVPIDDSLINAGETRARLARIHQTITGQVPGTVGQISTLRQTLYTALRQSTMEDGSPIFKQLQDLLDKELPNLHYRGPLEYTGTATGQWKDRIFIQHPDWFVGGSPEMQKTMQQAQDFMIQRLKVAQAMGYPIEALGGPYLEQMWDIPKSPVTSRVTLGAPGKVSIAKDRVFGDYLEGIKEGFTPKDMSVRELMDHSSALMDQAVADAFERRQVLSRFGSKVARGNIAQSVPFNDPLYKGWYGPPEIVNFVDQIHAPTSGALRAVQNVSAAAKGTIFGMLGWGDFGLHVLLSMAQGGLQALIGAANKSLETMRLPHAHIWVNDELPHLVQNTMDGVVQNLGPAAVTPHGGTLLKYIPKVGPWIDKPVSAAVDAQAKILFGQLRNLRNLIYEGNLVMLDMTGQDIGNAAVRRAAADNANALTGASRLAQTAGRRTAEAAGLTSPQMTRAQMATIAEVVRSVSDPTISAAQRTMGVTTLAALAATVYGVGSAINMTLGDGKPVEFDPIKADWASLHIGGRVIPLIPNRSLVQNLGRAVVAAAELDPKQFADVWVKYWTGRASYPAHVGLALAGYGYDPQTGRFSMGGLSDKARAISALPLPPIADELVNRPASRSSPADLALAVSGVRSFPESPYDIYKERFHKEYDSGDPAARKKVANDPELAKAFADNPNPGKTERDEAVKNHMANASASLQKTAQGVLNNDEAAAKNFRALRGDYLSQKANFEAGWMAKQGTSNPQSDIDKLVNQYYFIDPQDPKYSDVHGNVNWDQYNSDRQRILVQMPADTQSAIANNTVFADNPTIQQANAKYEAATAALQQVQATPKYRGMSLEQSQAVSELMRDVPTFQLQLSVEQHHRFTEDQAARMMAQRMGQPQLYALYRQITGPYGGRMVNPEYDQALMSNQSALKLFFPNFYNLSLAERTGQVMGARASNADAMNFTPPYQSLLAGLPEPGMMHDWIMGNGRQSQTASLLPPLY